MNKDEKNHLLAVLKMTKESIRVQLDDMYELLEEYTKDKLESEDE